VTRASAATEASTGTPTWENTGEGPILGNTGAPAGTDTSGVRGSRTRRS
jgi:hypothetical protein